MLEILIFCLAFICLLVGIVGAVLPILPGPIFTFLGILIIHFFTDFQFGTSQLILYAILTVFVFFSDYFLQFLGVKKFGGEKYSIYGTVLGIIIGLFFVPIGLIVGPFLGAFLGARIDHKDHAHALTIAIGSLFGFIFGTFIKIIYSIGMLIIVIDKLLNLI